MKNVLIINGGQVFAHAEGRLNSTITTYTHNFFSKNSEIYIQIVDINNDYIPEEEVKKFTTADIIIYHIPVWWYQVPFKMKEYIDKVFLMGYQNGMYNGDGRSRKSDNPKLHYGTGGLMNGKSYMLTTTWNAPEEAFIIPEEFFKLRSVDDGIMYPFHKMNEFLGLNKIESFHFYDMAKGSNEEYINNYLNKYNEHLKRVFKSF